MNEIMKEKLIIIMVGLPARGKSYITKKIANYLNWLNIQNEIFNVGTRRRQNFNPLENKADFFNPNSQENVSIREQLALDTLDELLDYLTFQNGQVGIFDATNSTISRREIVIKHIKQKMKDFKDDYNILFLESICNDKEIIERNILLKLNGPDYKKIEDKSLALNDFKQRLSNYESIYESVSSNEFQDLDSYHSNVQYLKIIDIVNLQTFNIFGFLPIILNSFLNNFQISKKNIYLTLDHINYDYLFNSQSITDPYLIILSSDLSKITNSTTNLSTNNKNQKFLKISKSCSLDQIHDLILQIESFKNDTVIQTKDEFLLNGILKYFNLINYSNKSILEIINKNVICINPDLYTVEYSRMKLNNQTIPITSNDAEFIQTIDHNSNLDSNDDCSSPPIMTRSNSSTLESSSSNISTPIDSAGWDQKFNYKDLNLTELTMKLELLK